MMITFPKASMDQYFETYIIDNFDVAKDESRLVFSSNLNGKFNLWALNLQGDLRYPYPLTYMNQRAAYVKQDPNQKYILAGFDHEGDENVQMYALPWEGGEPQKLIPAEEQDKLFFSHLSEDGERMYYTTSQGNPTYMNAHVLDLKTQDNRLLNEGKEATTFLAAVSPDETSCIYTESFSNTYQLATLKRSGEEDRCLTPSREVVHRVGGAKFIDEDTILFATDYEADTHYLAEYRISTGAFKAICTIEKEDIRDLAWHKESRTVYITTERGVADKLYKFKLDEGVLESMELPVDVVMKLVAMPSGQLYVLGRSAVEPYNIYRYSDESWSRLTQNVVVGLTKEDLVDPEVITYPSFDGMEIEALLFRAKPECANGYTVFWPHGGPQAAERKFFRAMFQYILAQGYHIFAPNFRGSTGYGSSFVKLVERDWGEGPRKDCVAGMEWLFEQGISSREKLFVVGGSYGGYMTLLLAGRHADYFRAAVDIFGVSNLFTFVNSVPEHWKPMMDRWVGDPERDRERFVTDSPITYLDAMTNPMLVIQGANDPRVVKEESDQIVEALRSKGRDVEYLVFDDEGHGFSKRDNEKKAYRTMVEFLNRHQS